MKSLAQNQHSLKSWREFIVSAYPELARQYFAQRGISNPRIEKFDGKIERLWQLIPNNYAIVDISSSGKTRDENGIIAIEDILTAQLVLYENRSKIAHFEGLDQLNILKILLRQRGNE